MNNDQLLQILSGPPPRDLPGPLKKTARRIALTKAKPDYEIALCVLISIVAVILFIILPAQYKLFTSIALGFACLFLIWVLTSFILRLNYWYRLVTDGGVVMTRIRTVGESLKKAQSGVWSRVMIEYEDSRTGYDPVYYVWGDAADEMRYLFENGIKVPMLYKKDMPEVFLPAHVLVYYDFFMEKRKLTDEEEDRLQRVLGGGN